MVYLTCVPFVLIGLLYALWIFYLAWTNLERAREANKLSAVASMLGTPVLLFGWLLDVVVNWTVMTLVFVELPKEKLVTTRLARHICRGRGWRKKLARFICADLLDVFDPSGEHCKCSIKRHKH